MNKDLYDSLIPASPEYLRTTNKRYTRLTVYTALSVVLISFVLLVTLTPSSDFSTA